MELQLPPLGGPKVAIHVHDNGLEGGAETVVEAPVEEVYDGDEQSEDEASVADDAEAAADEDDDADAVGVVADLSDSAPVQSALQERALAPKRALRIPGRYALAGLKRMHSDGRRRRVSVRSIDTVPVEEGCSGVVQDWLQMQECAFGDAGFGQNSNVFDDRDDTEGYDHSSSSSSSCGGNVRVSAVKRKHRTELNPTMTQAFKTLEGKEEWSPSIIKELTTLGPKEAFAIEQVPWSLIPAGADIIMLQPEHTTKKSSGEKKTRIVVNGSQEKVKPGENNYAPTALPKGLQILMAIAAHEGRLLRGIDIKCAFGSEFLTAEDGDIWVQYPDILEDHFGYLLDQQLEEQKAIIEEEVRTKRARPSEEDAAKDAGDEANKWEDCDDEVPRAGHWKNSVVRRSKKWMVRKQNKANIHQIAANGERKRRRYGRLRKSLYGLRRAARLFNCGLNKLLIENGYECCPADKCIYRKTFGTESILFNTHVDDFAVFPTCEAMFDELLSVLRTKYEITVTDRLEKHLGMQVNEYENGSVGMSQPNHLQVLFDLCGYGDDHVGAEIPMPVDWNEADQDDSQRLTSRHT
jgi:hypothetical protein